MESVFSYSQREISAIVKLRNSPLNFKSVTSTPLLAVNLLLCNCHHLTIPIRYDACHRPSPERDSRCINPASHQKNPGRLAIIHSSRSQRSRQIHQSRTRKRTTPLLYLFRDVIESCGRETGSLVSSLIFANAQKIWRAVSYGKGSVSDSLGPSLKVSTHLMVTSDLGTRFKYSEMRQVSWINFQQPAAHCPYNLEPLLEHEI